MLGKTSAVESYIKFCLFFLKNPFLSIYTLLLLLLLLCQLNYVLSMYVPVSYYMSVIWELGNGQEHTESVNLSLYILFSHPFPSLSLSVWTEESSCTVLNSTIIGEINCSYSCGAECWKSSRYPCLQVYVSLNSSGRILRLSHNEETQEANPVVYTKHKTHNIMGTLSRAAFTSWNVLVGNLLFWLRSYWR